jgi:uncharacterized membrane protein
VGGEGLNATLRGNIAALAARADAERREAPLSDRLARRITGFTGSMTFVCLHVVLFGAWIAINLGWLSPFPRFDPTLVILAMVASVEAIFLSTFVLITQNRMAALADRRADLDLHISLLTEHELTRLAVLIESIARQLEIAVDRDELAEIERDVEAVSVLEEIDAHRREENV